jgi:choline kinase
MLIERTHKTSKRLIVKDSDYIWHPMTIASTSNKKKEEVVLDVMKYYRNQYIRVQEKGKKKQRSNQTLLS